MSRYIDADKIEYEDMLRSRGNGNYEECQIAYRGQINDIPTADVVPMDFHDRCMEIEIQKRMNMVEVVRCKDCRHYDIEKEWCVFVAFDGGSDMTPYDFCSYGERG